MESITSPPSSSVSQPIIVPQLESAAWFALAIKLLRTKPPSLSIPKYFALLRSNTVPGVRSLDSASERRHIEACEFWRQRYEAEATRVTELQARVNELTGKFNTLSETNKVNQAQNAPKIVDQPQVEGPAKKKVKVTAKRADARKDVKRKTNLAGGQNKPQQQQQRISEVVVGEECVFDETFLLFSGSSISNLVASLRLLHFAREPCLVSKTITRSSKALQKVIQDFINGKLSTPVPSVHLTRGTTTAQAKELEGIINFSQFVERSCDKILSALSALVASSQEVERDAVKNTEFITDGVCAVIKNMTVILSSIQTNSRALLSEALSHPPQSSTGNLLTKDIRLELAMLLIRQLTKLDLLIAYQRKILEGTFYYLLEIIGGVLLRSFVSSSKDEEEDELLARLVVEETSWYLLRILEAVLPVTACFFETGGRKLEDISRERLKSVLIKGFLHDKTENKQAAGGMGREGNGELEFWGSLEKSVFGGNICIVDSPFSRVLWELLGLDILAD